MSRRYAATPLDLRTEDPRSWICRQCGDPLPPRTRTAGKAPVVHAGECKRLYVNRQKWAARIQAFRAAHRLVADRSDTLAWAVSPADVQTFDDDEGAYGMDGYDLLPGEYDHVHGKELKDAVNKWEAERAAANRRKRQAA